MLVIELEYLKPLSEIDNYLTEHRTFLQKYYEQGLLLASGPQKPRVGGIIIALADLETMQTIIKEDPFFQHKLADYRFIEFDPVKYASELTPLL